MCGGSQITQPSCVRPAWGGQQWGLSSSMLGEFGRESREAA